LPGDPEKETQAQRIANGAEIDPNSWQSVLNAAEQAGLNRETVAAMADISEA
jgi:LDH2 family malate/lactate/ureidoglycolate dehydrogenase